MTNQKIRSTCMASNTLLAATILLALANFASLSALGAPASDKSKDETASGLKEPQLNSTFANDVVGEWVSDWGPVKFNRNETGVVSGSWEEGKDKIGKIQSGKFAPSTGLLNFDFRETWTGLDGKATLKLSSDHRTLSGDWTRGKDKGTWTMHRPNDKRLLK